ncbi:hypothetical protein CLF_100090 [Clonorchis sinensis]|uniref:Uncharacterized protein n=1 Tax=Clonorchis sinensis TaxID=79923 RepID=G7Y2L7_CLOSI|nr:hypothetical protein CLF_100090 [Clonorchis sinensis]
MRREVKCLGVLLICIAASAWIIGKLSWDLEFEYGALYTLELDSKVEPLADAAAINTIHLFLVIPDFKTLEKTGTMLKSLLYYQGRLDETFDECTLTFNKPESIRCSDLDLLPTASSLTLHVAASDSLGDQTAELFGDFHVEDLTVQLYSLESCLDLISVERNGKAGDTVEMLKLFTPKILNDEVEKLNGSASCVSSRLDLHLRKLLGPKVLEAPSHGLVRQHELFKEVGHNKRWPFDGSRNHIERLIMRSPDFLDLINKRRNLVWKRKPVISYRSGGNHRSVLKHVVIRFRWLISSVVDGIYRRRHLHLLHEVHLNVITLERSEAEGFSDPKKPVKQLIRNYPCPRDAKESHNPGSRIDLWFTNFCCAFYTLQTLRLTQNCRHSTLAGFGWIAIGAVCEQGQDCSRSCSTGDGEFPMHGINTGLLLLNLNELRRLEWWNMTGADSLTEASRLTDRGLINQILERNENLYYKLPCQWNVQILADSGLDCCPFYWIERRPEEDDCLNTEDDDQNYIPMARAIQFNIDRRTELNFFINGYSADDVTLVLSAGLISSTHTDKITKRSVTRLT